MKHYYKLDEENTLNHVEADEVEAGELYDWSWEVQEKLVVPQRINGLIVEDIGIDAFAGIEELKSAVFPEGLKGFNRGAFYECVNLEHVIFPSTLMYIEHGAFYECSISDLTIKDGCPEICEGAFTSVSQAYLPNGLRSFCHNSFGEGDALKRVSMSPLAVFDPDQQAESRHNFEQFYLSFVQYERRNGDDQIERTLALDVWSLRFMPSMNVLKGRTLGAVEREFVTLLLWVYQCIRHSGNQALPTIPYFCWNNIIDHSQHTYVKSRSLLVGETGIKNKHIRLTTEEEKQVIAYSAYNKSWGVDEDA